MCRVCHVPSLLCAELSLNHRVDGHAYQSLRWYRSFGCFCPAAAHLILFCENIYENDIIACR